jgi:diketogulonate reductase-like aldo/keto reductase
MRTRPFGRTGATLAVIGQGTWNMERDDPAEAVAAIREAIDLGMTHIDTAELYGSGQVEKLVARAMRNDRDRVYLVSKVLPSNASKKGAIAACERSLARLGTDRLDLYLLHWPGSHPLAETVAAFEQLCADGKIRAWGVSNFDVADLEELAAVAPVERIGCNQVLYHVAERAIEHTVIPWCRDRGIPIVAYSPLGSGRFPSARSAGGQALARIAAARGLTPQQVALAFVVREDDVFAIPKATSLEHVRSNAAAGDVVLSAAEVDAIDRAFPRGRARSLPTL